MLLVQKLNDREVTLEYSASISLLGWKRMTYEPHDESGICYRTGLKEC